MSEPKWALVHWVYDNGETRAIRDAEGGAVAMVLHLRGRNGVLGRRTNEEASATAHLIAAAPGMAEAHDENARVLGFLVNELQGRIDAGKLEVIDKCRQRSLAMSRKARGEQNKPET